MIGGLGNGRSKALMAGAAIGAAIVGRRVIRRKAEADLTGEVALVTGASTGLGYLLATELASQGCKLIICARDENELTNLRDQLAADGHDALAIRCDVGDRSEVEELIARGTEQYGRIDILINNAGIIQVGPIDTMRIEDFEEAMQTMYWGVVYPTLAVLPQMKERGSGRISNITSIAGRVSVPHMLPYNSAKFAAAGFSEGLHAELEQYGITVTTIVPGLMRTGSFKNAEVKGQHGKELTWFALGSSLPLVSMNAERAASQIVQAIRRGDTERTLSVPATVLAQLHGLFPGVTQQILAGVNRFVLPSARENESVTKRGREVEEELNSQLLGAATTLGQSAAEEFQPDDRG